MKVSTPADATAIALEHLQELIAALDRRVPQIERIGEIAIAEEAAILKQKAFERMAQLRSRAITSD